MIKTPPHTQLLRFGFVEINRRAELHQNGLVGVATVVEHQVRQQGQRLHAARRLLVGVLTGGLTHTREQPGDRTSEDRLSRLRTFLSYQGSLRPSSRAMSVLRSSGTPPLDSCQGEETERHWRQVLKHMNSSNGPFDL
ncbi:hypothetical protein EYF80_030728 [Liparis tanakae]|uniref:Uncharacterized protein n=1 Tax=Liparis tanakae TaxID=230148 RepID=A0A4Z2H2Q2_9TELE|nr:hypothetical protein EYF80_030728 [Liparis tanakae]